jgi:hypothetical protein
MATGLHPTLDAAWKKLPPGVRDRWPVLLLPLLLCGCLFWWHEPTVRLRAGMLVGEVPKQTGVEAIEPEPKIWLRSGVTFRPLARYELQARVLSRCRYRWDQAAKFAPYDLVLGWNVMSDQAWCDAIEVDQSGRWYHFKCVEDWVDPEVVAQNSANTHCLPADDAVLSTLGKVRRGDMVELAGWLVGISDESAGWHWDSSTSRDDRGGHACEVFWIEKAAVITKRFPKE